MRRKAGEHIGPWRLERLLGSGANAKVWEAQNTAGDVVALKILNRVDPLSEPYKRFRDEITALRTVADLPGVLQIIDFSLPDSPSRKDPPWLAMPIAISIRKAMEEAPLEAVVRAIASVAETLSALAERSVFHRDIKPENLYRRGDRWVVGDFGLVEFPDKEALTAENRKLGPTYYLSPEMLINPAAAQAGPADVFSLAKTLWVLAAAQNYPPPGELRTDRIGARVSDVVVHYRSYLLDRLLERATVDDPRARPSMAEMATELRVWLAVPPDAPTPPDLSEFAARVASTFGPGLREERMRDNYKQSAIAAFQRVYNAMNELPAQFLVPTGLQGLVMVGEDNKILKSYLVRSDVTTSTGETLRWQNYATLPVKSPPPGSATLWCSAGAQVFDDGTLDLSGALLLGRYDFPQDEVWSLTRTVVTGSAEEDQAVTQIIAGLEENLPRALDAFLRLAAQDG
jgi:serine/threonine protein kinase